MGTYYHIFLDMDGVLTDFVSAVRKLGEGPAKGLGDGPRQEDRQAMDKAVEEAGEAFWSKMPWMKDGKPSGIVELSIEIPFDMPHFNRDAAVPAQS